ncbi:hypothetical protein [Aurantiacibacter luteus]|uniref:Lipoprotein n=1 Tax=Aurantiacibacter luteus TaxID=1581420 RepID=A0A0G9MYF6_9SPHN|nr:hypothetical protein [Aurantiacibacter luteus]KLE35725.1 hypothetical protein AAW00_04860 [Aurantiacibacter luteus]
MRSLLTLGLLAVSACVVTPPGGEPGALPSLAARQDAPRLAMMEHVLARYFSADITDRPTVCAAVHEGREAVALSPEDETALIARFPQLAPFARCTPTAEGWMDRETEEPALVHTIHGFTCPSATRCTGYASYNVRGAVSPSYLLTAEWRGGEWHFTTDPQIMAQ